MEVDNKISKGCRKDLGAYMEVPDEYKNSSDKIQHQHAYSVNVICGKNDYCDECKNKVNFIKKEQEDFKKELIEAKKNLEDLEKEYDDNSMCDLTSSILRMNAISNRIQAVQDLKFAISEETEVLNE